MFAGFFGCCELGVGQVKGEEKQGGGRQWEQRSKRNAVCSVRQTVLRTVVGIESRNSLVNIHRSELGTSPAHYHSAQCPAFSLLLVLVVEMVRAVF